MRTLGVEASQGGGGGSSSLVVLLKELAQELSTLEMFDEVRRGKGGLCIEPLRRAIVEYLYLLT